VQDNREFRDVTIPPRSIKKSSHEWNPYTVRSTPLGIKQPTDWLDTKVGNSKIRRRQGGYKHGCHRATTLMVTAISSSETSVNIYKFTWRNIPQGNHIQG
jgi:hypothetical protein